MLEWRLKAYRHWLTMKEPTWPVREVSADRLSRASIYYCRAEEKADGPKSLDEVDPELLKTYEKLGIPLQRTEAPRGRGGGRSV